MKRIYFIDSENVGDSWLPLLSRMEDDILVFYTSKSPYMNYDGLVLLKQSPKEVTFIKCFEGTNALDFQLVSELGFRLNSEKASEFIIVTNDTGYDAAVRYWQQKNYPVRRVPSKAVKTLLEPEEPARQEIPVISAKQEIPADSEKKEAAVISGKQEGSRKIRTDHPAHPGLSDKPDSAEKQSPAVKVNPVDQPGKQEGTDTPRLSRREQWKQRQQRRIQRQREKAAAIEEVLPTMNEKIPVQESADYVDAEIVAAPDMTVMAEVLTQRSVESEETEIHPVLKETFLSATESEPECQTDNTEEASEEISFRQQEIEPDVMEENPELPPPEATETAEGPEPEAIETAEGPEPEATETAEEPKPEAENVEETVAEAETSGVPEEVPETEAEYAKEPEPEAETVEAPEAEPESAGVAEAEPESAGVAEAETENVQEPEIMPITEPEGEEIEAPVEIEMRAAMEPAAQEEVKSAFNKEEVDWLINCIGRSNLGDLHNALELFYGEQGKEFYQKVKSSSYDVELQKWSEKERFFNYCALVFAHSELQEKKPEEFEAFLYSVEEKRKNLNALRSALQKKYGKEQGLRYYSLFKAHIKVLNRM